MTTTTMATTTTTVKEEVEIEEVVEEKLKYICSFCTFVANNTTEFFLHVDYEHKRVEPMTENKNNNLIKSEEETEEQVKKISKFLLQIEKVENIVFLFLVSSF
jgi:hypothetical protein